MHEAGKTPTADQRVKRTVGTGGEGSASSERQRDYQVAHNRVPQIEIRRPAIPFRIPRIDQRAEELLVIATFGIGSHVGRLREYVIHIELDTIFHGVMQR